MQIDHGLFELYTPADPVVPPRPEGDEEAAQWLADTAPARHLLALKAARALFLHNAAGVDWYTIAHAVPAAGRRFAVVVADRVVSVSTDPSTLWPIDARVFETDDADVAPGWRLVGGVLVDPATIAPVAIELKAAAAARRWLVETGGISVGGVAITTDATAQIKLSGAAQSAAAGLLPPSVALKARAGFVDASPAQITAVYAALVAHIQACYAAERDVAAAIDAGTITTLAAVDAWAGWPANS